MCGHPFVTRPPSSVFPPSSLSPFPLQADEEGGEKKKKKKKAKTAPPPKVATVADNEPVREESAHSPFHRANRWMRQSMDAHGWIFTTCFPRHILNSTPPCPFPPLVQIAKMFDELAVFQHQAATVRRSPPSLSSALPLFPRCRRRIAQSSSPLGVVFPPFSVYARRSSTR